MKKTNSSGTKRRFVLVLLEDYTQEETENRESSEKKWVISLPRNFLCFSLIKSPDECREVTTG